VKGCGLGSGEVADSVAAALEIDEGDVLDGAVALDETGDTLGLWLSAGIVLQRMSCTYSRVDVRVLEGLVELDKLLATVFPSSHKPLTSYSTPPMVALSTKPWAAARPAMPRRPRTGANEGMLMG
jgi:hypothetical protein